MKKSPSISTCPGWGFLLRPLKSDWKTIHSWWALRLKIRGYRDRIASIWSLRWSHFSTYRSMSCPYLESCSICRSNRWRPSLAGIRSARRSSSYPSENYPPENHSIPSFPMTSRCPAGSCCSCPFGKNCPERFAAGFSFRMPWQHRSRTRTRGALTRALVLEPFSY